tara:strand:- start:4847 stop:5551 length:705 start_codon:yes stop_codon:yes gene_type:complete
MNIKEKLKLNFHTWEEIKKIFFDKKFENVILFSQPRSGSTFVSNVFSKELEYSNKFFPEEFFINQHFVYLKNFVKKHNNFFINTNEFWFRRIDLKKKNTLYLYLYRDHEEIMASYQKAKKLNYYLGWEEMINNYRKFYPDLEHIVPAPLFGHKVWEAQIKKFDNAYTISYDSFKTHKQFLCSDIRQKTVKELKYINPDYKTQKKIKKVNFNIIEKIYFFIRRKLDSRKKSRKNY